MALFKAHSRSKHLTLAATPAAALTFTVFFGMTLMLDDQIAVAAESDPPRVLKIERPKEKEIEPRKTKREPVKLAELPPPPPKLSTAAVPMDFIPMSFTGSEPEPLRENRLDIFKPLVLGAIDRIAKPVSPPLPVYPQRAETRGVSGVCDIRFHLTETGEPYDLDVDCSDSVFNRSAYNAISKTRFMPKIDNGRSVGQRDMLYSIEYKIQ
ncbi:MAG: TonB family protein [Pseudomonadota bacterium]